MRRKPAARRREDRSERSGPLTKQPTIIELEEREGAIVFKEDGTLEAFFPGYLPEDVVSAHIQKMTLLMIISNDEELLKLAELKHMKQLENPN